MSLGLMSYNAVDRDQAQPRNLSKSQSWSHQGEIRPGDRMSVSGDLPRSRIPPQSPLPSIRDITGLPSNNWSGSTSAYPRSVSHEAHSHSHLASAAPAYCQTDRYGREERLGPPQTLHPLPTPPSAPISMSTPGISPSVPHHLIPPSPVDSQHEGRSKREVYAHANSSVDPNVRSFSGPYTASSWPIESRVQSAAPSPQESQRHYPSTRSVPIAPQVVQNSQHERHGEAANSQWRANSTWGNLGGEGKTFMIPMDTESASARQNEKRKRSAENSQRFRDRKKKKKEVLQSQIDELIEERDFYCKERDTLTALLKDSMPGGNRYLPRPPSPRSQRISRASSQASGSAQSYLAESNRELQDHRDERGHHPGQDADGPGRYGPPSSRTVTQASHHRP